jgi:hypothetical protein
MATLTSKLTESITMDSGTVDSTNTLSITGINEVTKRIVTVTTTEATILTFSAAAGQGTYIAANIRYIRFTNLDGTNHIMLTFKDEDNTEFRVLLDKGESFVYNADLGTGLVDTMKANGAALASGMADLYDITADADGGSCKLEYFIAST